MKEIIATYFGSGLSQKLVSELSLRIHRTGNIRQIFKDRYI